MLNKLQTIIDIGENIVRKEFQNCGLKSYILENFPFKNWYKRN